MSTLKVLCFVFLFVTCDSFHSTIKLWIVIGQKVYFSANFLALTVVLDYRQILSSRTVWQRLKMYKYICLYGKVFIHIRFYIYIEFLEGVSSV